MNLAILYRTIALAPVRRALVAALAIAGTTLTPSTAHAQRDSTTRRELYMSWGYSGESYSRTDMHIVQPLLGNDFVFHDVVSHDLKGWDKLFRHALTVPEYSFRLGWFFSRRHDLAAEINFEHARYIVTQSQRLRLTGNIETRTLDTVVTLTPDIMRYQMNNGANFLLFNLVKRASLRGTPGRTGNFSLLGKVGAGFLFPHADNAILGESNNPGFQFGGYDTGIEFDARYHFFRFAYVEFAEKGVFARYRGVKVNAGTAALNVWAHVTALSIGVSTAGR